MQQRLIQRCDDPIKPVLDLYWNRLDGSDSLQNAKISDPTEAIREHFSAVVGRRDSTELEWLDRTLNANPDLSDQVEENVWKAFGKRVKESYQSAEADEVRSRMGEIAHIVNVDLPQKDDDSESEEA